MVNLDWTLGIQIVNFLILIFILNILLYKPILKIMDMRKERLSSYDEEIKNLNLTIEKKVAEYEEKIRQAKMEAMNERNDIQRQGSDVAKEQLDKTKAELAKVVEEFQARLDQEIEQAKLVLKNQSVHISTEIAEKVLGRSLQ